MTQMHAPDIVCIWYPSGGFGHFLNAMLSLHSTKFFTAQHHHEFSHDGNSHLFPLVLPKYKKIPPQYDFTALDAQHSYTVLIDNGIDDETTGYRATFPAAARTIKLCYDDRTWPIVACTLIEKAMQSSMAQEISPDQDQWPDHAAWTTREKYFLYLRDHDFRHRWRPSADCHNIDIQSLLQYDTMLDALTEFGVTDSLHAHWCQWFTVNAKYLYPVLQAEQVLANPDVRQDLRDLTVWQQAVINYFIWLDHGIEIPANDYRDWFCDSRELHDVINSLRTPTST